MNCIMQALEFIDTGARLPPPPGCPRALYSIMISCWYVSFTDNTVTISTNYPRQGQMRELFGGGGVLAVCKVYNGRGIQPLINYVEIHFKGGVVWTALAPS